MSKISGALATLEIGAADDEGVTAPGSDTFSAIGGVVNYTGPGGEKAEIDVTDLASTGKEFIAGLPDFGEIPFTGWHDEDSAGQTTLWADFLDTATHKRNYRITFSDGTQYDIQAWIKALSHDVENDQGISFNGTLRASGLPTRTLS